MKKFLYKFLVVTLAFGMLTPTWLNKMCVPTKAEASPTITYVTTESASGITSAGATLNGFNGDADASGHSIWVSQNTFDTLSPTIPAGVYSTVDMGAIPADSAFSASLTSDFAGMPAVTPYTTYYFAAWSNIGGTWYPGSVLHFTTLKSGQLLSEDFGVVNYNVGGGLGILKGYTAGFGVTGATFEDAFSVVVKLYGADDRLLQTNTAILPKFNADITGTQFSSPFDVSGSFDYVADGYWTNTKEAEYGQSIPATKVVAKVTLANGKIVQATNIIPTGDPTILFPPTTPVASPEAGEYQTAQSVTLSSTDTVPPTIRYTLDGTDPRDDGTVYTGAISVDHDLTLSAVAYDEDNNFSGILTATYDIAPKIKTGSEVAINVGTTSATITWKTDQPATSRVVYGTTKHGDATPTSPDNVSNLYGYDKSSALQDSPATTNGVWTHMVTLSDLIPGTIYYYRVISSGSPVSIGSESSFMTSSLPPVVTTSTSTKTTVAVSQPATPSVSSTTPAVETPAVTTPAETGQIKGTETTDNQESEKINWTPWIILFILIILAGAATGGYFYWFGREDDEEIISKEVIEKSKKPVAKVASKKIEKPSAKKSKRW